MTVFVLTESLMQKTSRVATKFQVFLLWFASTLVLMSALFIACGFAPLTTRYALYACAIFCEAAALSSIHWFAKDGISHAINKKATKNKGFHQSRRSSAERPQRSSRSASRDSRTVDGDGNHRRGRAPRRARIISNPNAQLSYFEQEMKTVDAIEVRPLSLTKAHADRTSIGSRATSGASIRMTSTVLRPISSQALGRSAIDTASLTMSAGTRFGASVSSAATDRSTLIPRSMSINPEVVIGTPGNPDSNLGGNRDSEKSHAVVI
mmetsp:Transcript_8210/g.13299  ORF Transcript_8210/g.13299 Transcript_8210/m.13299 type:complete len:265 (+) Transcript_8210:2853-3647(+)